MAGVFDDRQPYVGYRILTVAVRTLHGSAPSMFEALSGLLVGGSEADMLCELHRAQC